MADTLDDLFDDLPPIEIPPVKDWPPIDLGDLWVNYDIELDDLAIHFNKKARSGIHVNQYKGYYIIVDPITHVPVGMHFEDWERDFVPQFEDIAEIWKEIRSHLSPDEGWNQSLRAFGTTVRMKMQTVYPPTPPAKRAEQALVPA